MATGKTDARVRSNARSKGGAARASRSTADAPRTDSPLTSQELYSEFTQEALPNAPEIPGWHMCWLSSTSNYDPIHKRIRLGYRPVKVEEVPGMDAFRMGTGEYAGVVACNEMLLFKIPQERYQQIMKEFHHDGPLREEEAIKAALIKGDEDSEGAALEKIEGDGFPALGQRRPASRFA